MSLINKLESAFKNKNASSILNSIYTELLQHHLDSNVENHFMPSAIINKSWFNLTQMYINTYPILSTIISKYC